MKTAGILILSLTVLLSATAFLCGYTVLRLPARRKGGKTRVACVGDSITYGCALPLFFLRRYPAVLQRLLGPTCQVAAFAVNDRTLQNSGNKPLRRERAFRQSLAFCPDVIVFLLGTNDSKDRNWVSGSAFREEYAALLAAYRTLPSKPRLLLCTPPCAFRPVNPLFRLTNDARPERIPMISEAVRAVAAEEGAELIDLYACTEGRRRLFGPDGLHPSGKGAHVIAEEVYRAIAAGARPASSTATHRDV